MIKANFFEHRIRYNLQFLLSGGGKFNYQGTKRWLEDQLENGGMFEALKFVSQTVFI